MERPARVVFGLLVGTMHTSGPSMLLASSLVLYSTPKLVYQRAQQRGLFLLQWFKKIRARIFLLELRLRALLIFLDKEVRTQHYESHQIYNRKFVYNIVVTCILQNNIITMLF